MNLRIIFRNSRILEWSRILYIDKAFVVVNKPPDFVTQYPKDAQTRTDLDAVAELVLGSGPSSTKLYPVHRLDKGTTGCLVFARSPAHAQAFSHQLKQKTVQKVYHALVDSSHSPILKSNHSGRIRVGMSLKKDGRPYISQSEPDVRETSTDWEVVGSNLQAGISLLKLHLHTGMKHQLRVHMSEVLQAPILGDAQHFGAQTQTPRLLIPDNRLFLHASEIAFHRFKRTGKPKRVSITLRAPLPGDLMKLCTTARIKIPPYLIEGGLLVNGQPMCEVPELDGFWVPSMKTPSN